MDQNERYNRVKNRVEEEKGFYSHLSVYLLMSVFFVIFDFLTAGGSWWYWPVIGWGIGIFSHWLGVFGKPFVLGKNWEERRIKQLMDEEENASKQ